MAGGTNSGRVGASLGQHRRHWFSRKETLVPQSECFKKRKKAQQDWIQQQSLTTLEIHVFRLFTEHLHSDLLIIHGLEAIETHSCVIEARSPKLYEILAKSFVYCGERIECNIEPALTSHRIEPFLRLLYSNSDIEEEERLLVCLFSESLKYEESSINYSRQRRRRRREGGGGGGGGGGNRGRRCESVSSYCSIEATEGQEQAIRRDNAVERVNSESEMADSGLETGSLSPLENTENSVTDLEESHPGTDCVSMDDDFISVDPNGEIDELSEYKKRSYSSCVWTDEKNNVSISTRAGSSFLRDSSPIKKRSNVETTTTTTTSTVSNVESLETFVPTESFEVIDPRSPTITINNWENTNREEKLPSRKDSRSTTTVLQLQHEFSNEPSFNKSGGCSSINSYYFIDASSLNDDDDDNDENAEEIYPAGTSKLPINLEEDGNKGTRENKVLEGSTIEKEALVVEIKEADSGESNQPSPSSDNNLKRSNSKVAADVVQDDDDKSLSLGERKTEQDEQIPPPPCCIVRRNTFELDPNDEKLSVLRQEYERRQGDLIFQNSIPQYSGHRVDGDSCFSLPNDPDTGISRASPPASLLPSSRAWMEATRGPRSDVLEYSSDWLVVDESSTITGRNNKEMAGRKEKLQVDASREESPEEIRASSRSSDERAVVSNNNKEQENKYLTMTDSCSESEDGSSRKCCNSLPITLNERRCSSSSSTVKWTRVNNNNKQKRDESTPIVSGGASSADHTPEGGDRSTTSSSTSSSSSSSRRRRRFEVYPADSSPSGVVVRRKTESSPIVSGGSVYLIDDQTNTCSRRDSSQVEAPTTRMASSMTTAWVVDMSDCGGAPAKTHSIGLKDEPATRSMSKSFSSSFDSVANNIHPREINNSKETNDTKHASLGFFVNLNDIAVLPPNDETNNKEPIIRKNKQHQLPIETRKESCEFFVDISGTSGDKSKSTYSGDIDEGKKNIFSMFIDFKSPTGCRKSDEEAILSRSEEKQRAEASRSFWSGKLASGEQSGGESSGSSRIEHSGVECWSSSNTTSDRGKPASVFMYIESDSPVVRRRALSSSRPAFQRHSWNVVESTSPGCPKKEYYPGKRGEHKRAHSVSVDRADLTKLQGKSSNSSHSLSEVARADNLENKPGDTLLPKAVDGPAAAAAATTSRNNTDTSTEEVFEYDSRDTPPNSHVEIDEELFKEPLGNRCYKEEEEEEEEEARELIEQRQLDRDEYSEISAGWDKTGTESTTDGGNTRKSETFDISSGGSGPSPESVDNHDFIPEDMKNERDRRYEEPQTLPEDDLSQVYPITGDNEEGGGARPAAVQPHKIESEPDKVKKQQKTNFTSRSIDSRITIKKSNNSSSSSSKESNEEEAAAASRIVTMRSSCRASFVRLSDLDKTPLRPRDTDVAAPVRADDTTRHIARMSNSIPETSWLESKLAVNRGELPPVKSLARKFTTIMSTSLPAKHKSPIDDVTECEGEALISESDLSSMQSSMGRSGADVSTEETETSSIGVTKPYNRLGEDLLRMFLEEINPDVTIDVGGRKIRAHKCILSSRCQYFAAILSGGWIESAGNVITLQGYSYNAVHFALCHIYSGESNIPETLSIVELATLADMLCLEGLKEVIGYTLKVKYCHLFHKPCQVCAVGVLECMPIAAAYGLDEVYRKSLRWITRHFVRIWPCKAFATLPMILMDKCYHQHIVHMSTDNVLQTMMDCDKLLATLPNVRWAEPVFRMVTNLLETSVKFISENFSGILANESFQALGRDLTWNISLLEDNLLAAADRLPPDQACKSYAKLNKMLSSVSQQQQQQGQQQPTKTSTWGPLFIEFLRKIQTRVEKCLVKEASRAARTTTWLKMDLELRRRIQELACLVILPHEPFKRPSRHSNFVKEPRVPPPRSAPAARSLDLRRVKMAISEHNDKTTNKRSSSVTGTTSAPVTAQQVKRPVLVNKPKSDPLERKNPQEEKQAITGEHPVAPRPKSWPNKMEVKSRYLEPRNKPVVAAAAAAKETSGPKQVQHDRVIIQQRRKIIISSSDSSRTSSPAMKRAIDKRPIVKTKLSIKKEIKALSSDSLAETTSSPRATTMRKEPTTSKSCGITRPESPSLKQTELEIGISVDSLAEPQQQQKKKKKQVVQTQVGEGNKKSTPSKIMENSMSTDSLMAEMASVPAPRSSLNNNSSSKVSPTMGRTVTTRALGHTNDRGKKWSPPSMQQKNLTTGARRLPRSLECSTAASRSRAAAISAYHGSPSNLRRNLLDAAKTPDISGKTITGTTVNGLFGKSSSSPNQANKRDKMSLSNQGSTESPTSKRSSPKSNIRAAVNRTSTRIGGSSAPPAKRPIKSVEDKTTKLKCHNGEVAAAAAAKQPTVGSRSGTFLKDEPTILNKCDIKTAQFTGS